ncbi:MAG: SpoIIE family protein phosphatase [Kiritimatiellae bacterium]|nr:SpoIIE family protein phosphatase [Kiritimatiellia bacterium]
MTPRRGLNMKLVLSVFAAFLLSMAFTWFLHSRLSERDAYKLIDRTFENVKDEITDCVDERLVLQCMAVRERIEEDAYPVDTASLQALAKELHVTEINVADTNGDIVASTLPGYLAAPGKPAFNFKTAGGLAEDMMCLVDGPDTEYCQPYRSNTANGEWRKFVGVWMPSTGGFVEIGCDGESLRGLARSSLMDLFRNWRVGGTGGIVVTTTSGLILSDYEEPNREGAHWDDPDGSFYWKRKEIEGFPTYVMIPRDSAAVQRDVLVGATAVLNGAALVFVALLVGFVISSFVRQQMREQAARDLEMARDIQLSALPSVFPPFPDEQSFSIWALMDTAKEVGGDFYDFYFTGQDRVLFLIADVSGKGVPAAMFMMRAKALIKSAAQTGKTIAQVFDDVNDALCEGNSSSTFVTVWAGELNIHTGRVIYVNAGHNSPVVRRAGGCEFLRSRPSLVLGAMPGIKYMVGEVQLEPGDAIYLYTDGITEQPNASGELYGDPRLLKHLSNSPLRGEALLKSVLEDVRMHAAGAEQADDCTQLVIRYRGTPDVFNGEYAPTMDGLAAASADLAAALESVPGDERARLMTAADEIFSNIVKYSGATRWTLAVARSHCPEGVRLTISDDGKPFDPLSTRDPDTKLCADDMDAGGLGILIVKKTMSPVAYKRRNGLNILTMGKDYGESPPPAV